jgi:hypothetical protein
MDGLADEAAGNRRGCVLAAVRGSTGSAGMITDKDGMKGACGTPGYEDRAKNGTHEVPCTVHGLIIILGF